jgi:hypothetical protein
MKWRIIQSVDKETITKLAESSGSLWTLEGPAQG